MGLPWWPSGKESCQRRRRVQSLGWKDTLELERNSNPLQHSYLEIPRDRGAWQATIHGSKKETQLCE